jgi:hypothetical protein
MISLKNKKCHGYDNIPLVVLKDGAKILASPFTRPMENLTNTSNF